MSKGKWARLLAAAMFFMALNMCHAEYMPVVTDVEIISPTPTPTPVPHKTIVRRLAVSNNLLAVLDENGSVSLTSLIDGCAPEEALGDSFAWNDWTGLVQVAVGSDHIVGLTREGMVVGAGVDHGQLGCVGLTGVCQIVAGDDRTACVMDDGSVALYGVFGDAQGLLSHADGIVELAMSETHVVALHEDGTAQAFALTEAARREGCAVQEWTGLMHVAAGYNYAVGVRTNGRLLYAGIADGMVDQCARWKNVISVAAGNGYILGLRTNGTVVSAGNPEFRFARVDDWKYMTELAAGYRQCVGIDWQGNLFKSGDEGEE